jgi:hypothetical protein
VFFPDTMKWIPILPITLGAVLLGLTPAGWAQPIQPLTESPRPTNRFDFQHGDHVLFVGGGWLAAERQWGYVETRLTLHYPARDLTFRNLAWTNTATAADEDAPPAAAWKGVTNAMARFRPTVAVVSLDATGTNHSLIPSNRFAARLGWILEHLKSAGGTNELRCLVLGPRRLEPPWPLRLNNELTNTIHGAEAIAQAHAATFVDLRELLGNLRSFGITNPVTSDGITLTRPGHRTVSELIPMGLNWEPNTWRAGILKDGTLRPGSYGAAITNLTRSDRFVRCSLEVEQLPCPPILGSNQPVRYVIEPARVQVQGLTNEHFQLSIDGKNIRTLPFLLWQQSAPLLQGPDFDQAETLRLAIVEKNALASGEAEEQAGDVEARVAALERRIATLRRPVARTYEFAIIRATNAPAAKAP